MKNPRINRELRKPSIFLVIAPEGNDYEGDGVQITHQELEALTYARNWTRSHALVSVKKKLKQAWLLLLQAEIVYMENKTLGLIFRCGGMDKTIRETNKIRRLTYNGGNAEV